MGKIVEEHCDTYIDDEVLYLQRVVVNEGFEYVDRIFKEAHLDILNCNKGDEQHTKFYFKEE